MEIINTILDLKIGQHAVVTSVCRDAPDSLRLQELGILPGTPIQLLRKAPLGDPLEIKVRGACLSLRLQEASSIGINIS